MSRILYMSDLHLEMERWRLGVPGWAEFMARHRRLAEHPARGPLLNDLGRIDLVVLAGDIHNGYRGVVYAHLLSHYLGAPVVMVAGNHEFYHHDIGVLLPALRTAAAKTRGRVQFLENAAATFDLADGPVTVLGCTLWTDYALHGAPETAMFTAERRMNDHAFIRLDGPRFTPADALARHQASRRWLHEALAARQETAPGGRNLIVTHHAPDAGCLGSRTGAIAPCYSSDLLAEFAPWRPAGWIHGHTHYRHDSMQAGIRVVSAPRGYVAYEGQQALHYRPGILEI